MQKITFICSFKSVAISIIILLTFRYSVTNTNAFGFGSRASFRQPCDKTTRCDSAAALICKNGTCNCIKEESMTFDPINNHCVALAGEKCKFTVVEEVRSWLEEVACIQNAQCTPLGICSCDPTFTEAVNGSCIPKSLWGQECNTSSQCRNDLHLHCLPGESNLRGKCGCDPATSIYGGDGKCVGLAEKPCLSESCTINAYCRGFYGGHSVDSYEEYSGEDTKCSCSPGYIASEDGLCGVGHGGACDPLEGIDCVKKFKCINGSCSCSFPGHQQWDEVMGECLSLVGGPCTSPSSNSNLSSVIHCLKPGVCQPKGKFRLECGCSEGMVESQDRLCDLSYGRMCQSQIKSGGKALVCDKELICVDGKCSCEDELKFWEPEGRKCRGFVGSDCWVEHINFCVEGAYCQPFRGSETRGKCECTNKFNETINRTCIFNPKINFVI